MILLRQVGDRLNSNLNPIKIFLKSLGTKSIYHIVYYEKIIRKEAVDSYIGIKISILGNLHIPQNLLFK